MKGELVSGLGIVLGSLLLVLCADWQAGAKSFLVGSKHESSSLQCIELWNAKNHCVKYFVFKAVYICLCLYGGEVKCFCLKIPPFCPLPHPINICHVCGFAVLGEAEKITRRKQIDFLPLFLG